MPIGQDASYRSGSRFYLKQQPSGFPFNGNTIVTEEIVDIGGLSEMFGLSAYNGQILPGTINFTITPNGSTITKVSIQVADNGGGPGANGQAITKTDGLSNTAPTVYDLDIVLALSTGVITTLTPSTGLSVVTGTLFNTYVAGKAIYVQTNASGLAEVNITDTGRQGFYVMVQGGMQPVPAISRQLVVGDYG